MVQEGMLPGEPTRKKPLCTLKTYIQSRREAMLPVIPEDHRVFSYAAEIDLPREFLAIAWYRFKDKYLTDDLNKKYKDWPTVFLKATKENWMKCWYLEGDVYKLTTVGLQAQKAMRKGAASV